MKQLSYILFYCMLICNAVITKAQNADSIIRERLNEIKIALDSSIFVNRFQSTETPCVYIDPTNDAVAEAKREVVNSNYRVRLTKESVIDSNGVKCLSEYCSRYLRFMVKDIDFLKQKIIGDIEATYAYPVGNLIQYYGFTVTSPNKTKAYFERLLRSEGTFELYPQGDRYIVKIKLLHKPYDKRDEVSGYLEIVREAYRLNNKSISFYFDEMSLSKGDKNNQIFLRFSSTNHLNEGHYFAGLVYHVLKNMGSADLPAKANAIWLDNYLKNPACVQCLPVYNSARAMVRSGRFSLPNTEPIPPH